MNKIITLVLFLTVISRAQDNSENTDNNSTDGLVIIVSELYQIGYNFSLDSSSVLRATILYNSDITENFYFSNKGIPGYTERNEEFNSNKFALSVNYTRDLFKLKSSKFYAGIGPRFEYYKSESENIRELIKNDITNLDRLKGQYKTFNMRMDLFIGYELKLASAIKVFGEVKGYIKWKNVKDTITNGWDFENPFILVNGNWELSAVKSYVSEYNQVEKELEGSLGIIISF